MILKTVLFGQTIAGFASKKIIHPYSGISFDSLEYSRGIDIRAFTDVKNMRVFKSDLINAAVAINSYLEKNKNKILKTVSDETGSPISYHVEDMKSAQMFLRRLQVIRKKLPLKYLFEPKGNVLLILPANEPVIMGTVLIFSSLFMGNTVFVKPSSKTPFYVFSLIKELAKMPTLKKRIHCLLTDRKETERLIKTRVFDFVLSFASRSTNKKLGGICANSEVEFSQESEGNDWVYLDRDCGSLKKVSKMIVNSFIRHNGQMCNSIRGIMVHSSFYEAFVSQLKNNLSSVFPGSPRLTTTRIGALLAGTSAKADLLVKEASAKSESIWNFSMKNNIITPSLILNPDNTSSIFSESIFAPVIWIKKVENYSEALSLYQGRNAHGLSFSVFSNDKKVVNEFVNRIKAGRININKDPLKIGPFDPLGGIKLSGHGGPGHWVEKVSNRKYINA